MEREVFPACRPLPEIPPFEMPGYSDWISVGGGPAQSGYVLDEENARALVLFIDRIHLYLLEQHAACEDREETPTDP